MDWNLKGKTWVGNICQKFEVLCQQVDGFVSQEKVKYVENQVQAVGRGEKNLSSVVVQDLVPLKVDPIKHEEQTAPQKQMDIVETFAKSTISTEEKAVDIDIKLSPVQDIVPPKVDPVKHEEQTGPQKQMDIVGTFANSTISTEEKAVDIDIKQSPVQGIVPPKVDHVKHEEQTGPQKQMDIVGTFAKSTISTEEKAKVDPVKHEEQTAPQKQMDIVGTFEKSMISTKEKAVDIDKKQSSVEQEPNDPLENCHTPSFAGLCPVNHIISLHTEDLLKDADNDVDALIYKNTDMGVEGNVNLDTSVEEIPLTEERTVSLDSSYSEDKNLSEALFSEPSDANISQKEEKICCDPVHTIGRVFELSGALSSSESFSTLARDKEDVDVDVGLAVSSSALSLESNDADSARTDEAVSLAGSFRYEHEQSWKCARIEDFMSPLEIGHVDGSGIDSEDGSMESIDLSDDENPDESCLVVDCRSVYSFSYRARKFSSCKKILQDAFTSRKRLAKEYEQLGILYGDIDGETSRRPDENMLPSIAAMVPSFKAKKSATEDSEWELV